MPRGESGRENRLTSRPVRSPRTNTQNVSGEYGLLRGEMRHQKTRKHVTKHALPGWLYALSLLSLGRPQHFSRRRHRGPWMGGCATTSQGHNPDAQWGSSVATRNGEAIQTGHVTTAASTTAGYRTSTGQRGIVTQGANRTVARGTNGTYVGHDGNVYCKDSSGNWRQYNNGSWNHVDTSNAQAQTQQRVQRASQNRTQTQNLGASSRQPATQNHVGLHVDGQAQTQRFQNFRCGDGGRFRR